MKKVQPKIQRTTSGNSSINSNSKYPSWFKRSVYIFGESYGGHWVPGLAYSILQQNALNLTGFTIILKGIGLADPRVDPLAQAVEYPSFGISVSLIDDYQENRIRAYSNSISSLISKGNFTQAHDQWSLLLQYFVQYAGGINIYNMRLYQDYDFSDLSTFMNLDSTKTMLNVPVSNPWIECNETVYGFYKSDMMNSTLTMIQSVLSQGVSVLVLSRSR
jgi:carboxypeptidase C (cathepsin A)